MASEIGQGTITLADVAADSPDSFVDGPFGSNLKSAEYVKDGVRLIQLQNIGDGRWIDSNRKFISQAKFQTLRRHGARPGEIAIAKMADPVARACLLPPVAEQFLVVADCIKLCPDPSRFDASYVCHAINSQPTRHEAEIKSSGTTRLRINLSVLKTVRIWAPPLPHQQRLALVLDTLDEAIHKTEQLIAKLELVKQGVVHDLLTRGIDENGELRDPERHSTQFAASILGPIPKGWDVITLSDAGDWVSGGTPSKAVPAFWGGRVPWVTPKDMKSLWITTTADNLTGKGALRSRLVPADSVLVVVRGMILAHTFPVSLLASPMAFNQDIKGIVPAGIDGRFLAYWLLANSDRMLRLVTEATHGTKRIDTRQLGRQLIARPPLPEQARIVEIVDSHERRIDQEGELLGKLQLIRLGLANDLLTGRVRVTTVLDEGAA